MPDSFERVKSGAMVVEDAAPSPDEQSSAPPAATRLLDRFEITLDGETVTLHLTPRVLLEISRHFGGLLRLFDTVQRIDLDVLLQIIRIGAGMTDEEAKTLEERAWRTGFLDGKLQNEVGEYFLVLCNGGRPRRKENPQGNAAGT